MGGLDRIGWARSSEEPAGRLGSCCEVLPVWNWFQIPDLFITFHHFSSQFSFHKRVSNRHHHNGVKFDHHESRDVTRQLADGYVFFDWFAIPQITARAKGTNEDLTRSDAAKAVQSIPFYVEARLEVWSLWKTRCKINRIVTLGCAVVHLQLLRCLSVGAGVHDSNGILIIIIFRIAISQEIESGFTVSQLTPPALGVQLICGIGAWSETWIWSLLQLYQLALTRRNQFLNNEKEGKVT